MCVFVVINIISHLESIFFFICHPSIVSQHSKVTIDIYAKVKYNKPEKLISVVNKALNRQASTICFENVAGDKNGVKPQRDTSETQ